MRTLHVLAACALVAATASAAAAHCCHDATLLGARHQSEFRRGVHGLNDDDNGLTDESLQAEPPTIGRSRGGGDEAGSANDGVGGFGQLRGNSIGNYGAGSLGERGPGGLGAMQGTGLGQRR